MIRNRTTVSYHTTFFTIPEPPSILPPPTYTYNYFVQLILKNTPLSAIAGEDELYFLAPGTQPGPLPTKLVQSITLTGVLHPPLVQATDQNTFRIVSGFKRIAVLKNLDPDAQLPCLHLPSDFSQQKIFTAFFHHWVLDRQPSIIEQATFFSKTRNILDESTLLSFAQHLGHKPTMRIIDDLICLLDLETTVIIGLHDEIIHPRSARKLRSLDASDQKIIASLITTYKLGGSKQQKLIDLGMELVMRKVTSWRDIGEKWLAGNDGKAVGQNIPQLSGRLLESLHKQCFPLSSQAESQFNDFVRSLNLPSNATVNHSPFFEGDEVWITMKYAGKDEMENSISLNHDAIAFKKL